MGIMKTMVLGITFFTITGCASMMSGTTQSISVSSVPEGAKVFIVVKDQNGAVVDKTEAGVTPTDVVIPRKDGQITLEKEGYEPAEVPLVRKMNPWVWGDILLGSLLSTSIDTSTGASNEFDPGEYSVELKQAQ